VGAKGGNARNEDFIEHIYPAMTHNTMMFFTQGGRCFWMKVYEIPEGNKTFKGRAIQNLLNIESTDKVTAFICIENINDAEWVKRHNLIFCTRKGTVKKSRFELYSHPRSNGLNAINLVEGDEVIDVCLTSGNDDVIIANRNGRAIRFNENAVRLMGRVATGVRGLRLDNDGEDEVVGMIVMDCNPPLTDEQLEMMSDDVEDTDIVEEVLEDVADTEELRDDETQVDEIIEDGAETVMVVSEKGFGKRSVLAGYRITNRGGKGVKTLNITDKTGKLIALKSVTDEDDLMIINKSGVAIRLALKDIRVQGRNTQGVSLINLKKRNDVISSVCKVPHIEEEELVDENENQVTDLPEVDGASTEQVNIEE
jgi:DNA gyrase subunit A